MSGRSLHSVPLANLTWPSANPRRQVDDAELAELAASIKLYGVLQPIGVRVNGKGYEGVYGARRAAAAKLAGLDEIPAVIVPDKVADGGEVRLVENIQRAALSPLDEAAAILALRESGHGVRDIARRLGKSVPYVARRANLENLAPSVRKKLLAGELEASVRELELIAMLPEDEQWDSIGEPAAVLEAAVADHTRELGRAPWDLEDDTLKPEAGACASCLKHSGHSPGLFDGGEVVKLEGAVCRDLHCWDSKQSLHCAQWIDAAREKHGKDLILLAGQFERDAKSDDLVPEHWTRPHGAKRLPIEEKIQSHSNWVAAKKGADGARPALVVRGKGSGAVRWVKPATGAHAPARKKGSSKAAAAEKPKPGSKEDLAAKRDRLAERRVAWQIQYVAEQVAKHVIPPPDAQLLALYGYFGAGGYGNPLESTSWVTVEQLLARDGHPTSGQLAKPIWTRVRENVRRGLVTESRRPEGRARGLRMARAIAQLCLGVGPDDLARYAQDAIPPPKALMSESDPRRAEEPKPPAKKKATKKRATKKAGRKA